MNTISKLTTWTAVLLLVSCVQGPWSFWPASPDTFRGIWVTGQVIAGWPVQQLCLEPVLPLTSTRVTAFAFYDSASVTIQGSFNGSNTKLTLVPRLSSPNCFDGPSDQIPAVGKTYNLDARVVWDSAGSRVTTHLTANTTIPLYFGLVHPEAIVLAKMDTILQSDSLMQLLAGFLGDTVLTLRSNRDAWDAYQNDHQTELGGMLLDVFVPFQSGDTLRYLNPPFDLKSHHTSTTYSDDVQGVLVTQHYPDNIGRGASSFDNLFGTSPDTSDKAEFGNTHRIEFLAKQYNSTTNSNFIDTLGISNAYLYIGENRFYFFAVPQEYTSYEQTAIEGASDSRIRPISNITGGMGVFAGFIVDSLIIPVKALPGSVHSPSLISPW